MISVGPALDVALGGGVPEGTVFVISGKPKIGKTTTILSFAAQAQKLGKRIWYFDVEHRLKKKNLHGILGLNSDPSALQIIQSSAENILHGEGWLAAAEEVIRNDPGSMIIFDSASALCSETEYVEPISGQRRSLGPKLMAAFCRRNAPIVGVNNSILVIVQHLMANTSGKGRQWVEDGGEYIKFQMDTKVRALMGEDWDAGEKRVGLKTTWLMEESANEARPGIKVESWIRFGIGIDRIYEIIESACNFGLISTSSSWYSFNIGDKEKKWQGKEKMWQHFNDNPEDFELLNKQVRGLLYNEVA